jgi:DNA-binding NtrC family response regulator
MGKAKVELRTEAEALLLKYAWPGNIRELANVLERAMILQRGARLEASDLGLQPRRNAPPDSGDELLPLREMERLHVERVLQRTSGKVTEAAQILGMARRTLYDRMKVLGITPPKD